MRKLILAVGLIVVGIACADTVGEMLDSGVPDAGAQPTPTPTAKFVGYTSAGYRLSPDGTSGVGGLFNTYAACQSDFGATARICTVAEVLRTVDLPAPPPGPDGATQTGAWVVESLTSVPSCWTGTGTNRFGTHIEPDGWLFTENNCTVLRVLACCTVN